VLNTVAALMSGLDDSDPKLRVFFYDLEELLERLRLMLDLPPAIVSQGRVCVQARSLSLSLFSLSLFASHLLVHSC
jgi:hypothetical protein